MQWVPVTINIVSWNPVHGEMYSIKYYVIKFLSDMRYVGGFRLVSATIKSDRHDIAELLLKVALSVTTLTLARMNQLAQWDVHSRPKR